MLGVFKFIKKLTKKRWLSFFLEFHKRMPLVEKMNNFDRKLKRHFVAKLTVMRMPLSVLIIEI